MAISTYDELKAAVANWMDRSDLSSRIPTFISLAEARFKRKLRVREMETTTTVAMTAGQDYIALPTGYVELLHVYVDGDPKRPLETTTLAMMNSKWAGSQTAKPRMAAVSGSNLYLAPTPDSAYNAEVTYYKFDELSDTNTTNFLLTSHPDIYLRGAQAEAEFFLKNPEMAVALRAAVDMDLETLSDADWYSGIAGPMRMRTEINP